MVSPLRYLPFLICEYYSNRLYAYTSSGSGWYRGGEMPDKPYLCPTSPVYTSSARLGAFCKPC